MAKDAARKGKGPWGEAIQYWFREKELRQSHIVEGTGMPPNKVSRAANGLNVRMDTLREIADFFGVPLEEVLVSPEHRLSAEAERHVAENVVQKTLRAMEQSRPASRMPPVDPQLLAIARRLKKLPPRLQQSVVKVIAGYEKADRKRAPAKKE